MPACVWTYTRAIARTYTRADCAQDLPLQPRRHRRVYPLFRQPNIRRVQRDLHSDLRVRHRQIYGPNMRSFPQWHIFDPGFLHLEMFHSFTDDVTDTVIYTSTNSPKYPLAVDLSMHDVGAKAISLGCKN